MTSASIARKVSGRSLLPLLVALLLPLLSLAPARAEEGEPIVLTPAIGMENGGIAFGANLRYFFLPNLAGEIDGAYGDSLCQNCRLSATTLTGNLVYEIHPIDRLALYAAAGGGAALLDLSSPRSARATLGEVDCGAGIIFALSSSVGISLEDRWFLPVSGAIPDASPGAITLDRIFLGVSVGF
jgi:hypothetical protein